MVNHIDFAEQADSDKYKGIPYSKLDCQGFVEEVLYDCGVRKANGTRYNWKGSNSMWRNALSWKGTIAEAVAKFGAIPRGAWMFTVKRDGGEVERGYHDNEGNASHVGIYIEGSRYRHSTKTKTLDGVSYGVMNGSWTHVGIPKMIDFDTNAPTKIEVPQKVKDAVETIAKWIKEGV